MSNRHALIEGSDVVNIILLKDEDDFEPPPGQLIREAPDEVTMGWKWRKDIDDQEEWIEPEPEPVVEAPAEPPAERTAKETAVSELIAIGLSEASARLIVGLQVSEEVETESETETEV